MQLLLLRSNPVPVQPWGLGVLGSWCFLGVLGRERCLVVGGVEMEDGGRSAEDAVQCRWGVHVSMCVRGSLYL